VLREKADKAEAGRLAELWKSDPVAALLKEQEKNDRNAEVEQILKEHGTRLLRQPKNVITKEEMEAVREMQEKDPEEAKKMMDKLRRKEVRESCPRQSVICPSLPSRCSSFKRKSAGPSLATGWRSCATTARSFTS
jgi:hypothetical protein